MGETARMPWRGITLLLCSAGPRAGTQGYWSMGEVKWGVHGNGLINPNEIHLETGSCNKEAWLWQGRCNPFARGSET